MPADAPPLDDGVMPAASRRGSGPRLSKNIGGCGVASAPGMDPKGARTEMDKPPSLETRSAQVKWDGLLGDVTEALTALRLCWETTEQEFPHEVHAKIVHDLYVPAIRRLGAFCACILSTEDPPSWPQEASDAAPS